MIEAVIRFALQQRLAVALMAVIVVAVGIWSVFSLPIDSFPDVSNVQVQVITEPESMAAEEIESQITFPIESGLNGVPRVTKIRSNSSFGLSVVTAIFEEGTDVYFARQLVQQRLNQIDLPEECPRPKLGPVVSSFSNVFMYALNSKTLDLRELRTIQDWYVSKRLRAIPGVANVVSYGGFVKQYQVLVNPYRLRSYGVPLMHLVEALASNNENAGANFIETAGEEVIIRGIGRIKSVEDIEEVVLKSVNGVPIKVGQVGEVTIGNAFRRGSASRDGLGEAVVGIIQTRKGVNSKEVLKKVKMGLQEIQEALPAGVTIEPVYDQTELVDKSIETVQEILLFSGGLVIIILFAVLLHIPSALIVAVIIPFSLLFSFILMKFTGLSANLMTLGAVEFGVVVDASVVMVENIFRHMAHVSQATGKPVNLVKVVERAALEVGRPIAFAIFIIMAVYIPLFTLEGVEGKMFHPLALTFIFAMLGALLGALTIIPVLCTWFMQGPLAERENPVIRAVQRVHEPMLDFALRRGKTVLIVALAFLAGTICLLPFLGSEFIPSLDEGSILLRLKFPPSIAHTETRRLTQAIEKILKQNSEVEIIVTRIGRSGPGSDLAAGVDSADMYLGLKPKKYWRVQDKEVLVDRLAEQVKGIPGLRFSFSQPIADMVDDLVAGIRADLGIKIFGNDLLTIDKAASQIEQQVLKVPGAADVQKEQMLGAPQLKIEIDRHIIARHGLNVDDVQDVLATAIAGKVATEVFEDNRRFGLLVRLASEFRQDLPSIEALQIETPGGAKIPLHALATIKLERGTVMINREDGIRRTAVLANVRGRDLGSFVAEAQAKIAKLRLPKDITIVWGGQFENQQRALARLAVVLPVVLSLIFILLFVSLSSLKNAALVMLNVPFAMIGGICALLISGQTLSVPAMIGFIALFGIAVQNGIIMISYLMQLQKMGRPLREAVVEGTRIRLRPVLMTAMVAIVGLMPKILSHGTGAEVQRPMATVVLGGLVTATVLTLVVLPSLFTMLNKTDSDSSV